MRGLDIFASRFKGLEDCYTLIGGAAAELLHDEVGLSFRATKDLDIVVLLESPEVSHFAITLKEFVADGGYQPQIGRDGEKRLYRFIKPIDSSYPVMLELFSWVDIPALEEDVRAVRLSADVVATSLSALLLDESYYEFLKQGGRIVDGVNVLDTDTLILFKMKAWLDLTSRVESGDESIDSRDIKKHLNDVLRLQRLLDPNKVKTVSPSIQIDVDQFLQHASVTTNTLKNLKIKQSWDAIADELRRYYL